MKITIKKLKVQERLSAETLCFSADIYVDGQYAGEVTNQGQGGCNFYGFDDKSMEKRLTAYAVTHPEHKEFAKYPSMCLDSLIDDAIEAEQETQQMKRWCKTKTVVKMKGDKEGEYSIFKILYSPETKAKLLQRHGDKVVEIINERFL